MSLREGGGTSRWLQVAKICGTVEGRFSDSDSLKQTFQQTPNSCERQRENAKSNILTTSAAACREHGVKDASEEQKNKILPTGRGKLYNLVFNTNHILYVISQFMVSNYINTHSTESTENTLDSREGWIVVRYVVAEWPTRINKGIIKTITPKFCHRTFMFKNSLPKYRL